MASLEITTLVGCPLMCSFCPQDALMDNYKSTQKRLTLSNFLIIISKLPPSVRIDFSGMSEPFVNPEAILMVMEASKLPNPISIFTTLSGLKRMDTDSLKTLILLKRFDKFVIHLPDNTGNMRGFKFTSDYLYALETLLVLPNVISMTMSPNAKIDKSLLGFVKESSMASTIISKLPKEPFIGIRRAGSLNTEEIDKTTISEPVNWECGISCSVTPFYDHNVVLPDGRVVLCCMDYNLQHVLGNLLEESYDQIMNSKELRLITSANASLDPAIKSNVICTNCENVCRWECSDSGQWNAIDPNISLVKHLLSVIRRRIKL